NLHPASSAWFSASDPMNWSLSLPWSEFDAMYRAANAEHISLLAEDLAKGAVFEPLLVDGGITHPSVLVQVMPVERIICLTAPDTILENTWELSEERQAMKRYVLNLEDGQNKWQKFLQFDRLLWKKMMDESEKEGIPILRRDLEQTEHLLSALAADSFGFSRSKKSAETGNQS
ncbi:MAG: hypothetical protein ACK2T3_09710, partial [Candidatus Promineifilaceae bacterium]